MHDSDKNQEFLDRSANQYHGTIIKGWEKLYHKKREYLYNIFKKYHQSGTALELGSADGIMTKKLCGDFTTLTVVDGSALFLQQVKENVAASNLKLVHSLFEDFTPDRKYDTIFMSHILEHLDDPVSLLIRSRSWLAANGRILVSVPNANSLHRFVGVKLGLLPSHESLNEQDVILGHRRVYSPSLLKQQVTQSGLTIAHFGGIMIKPLSNRQIEAQWSDELIDAFFALSDDFPELCSEIYIVAEDRK
jgi:2-polyprenyl-3-methyl-5-hydroxy-6-metoxy-1,4-benzoquinol methylase